MNASPRRLNFNSQCKQQEDKTYVSQEDAPKGNINKNMLLS